MTAKNLGRSKAGRKGGLATKKNMPPDYYKEIGRKGGKARKGQIISDQN